MNNGVNNMSLKLFSLVLCCLAYTAYGQTHFTKYRPIVYKSIQMTHVTDMADTTRLYLLDLSHSRVNKNIRIELRGIKKTDSSSITVYQKGKQLQKFFLPYPIWHLDPQALLADINGDKQTDLKFRIYGTGSGLAGLLSTKVYLFRTGDKFKLISFFDFVGEKEYDLNNDGNYEILSCNHVYKGGHSYWVYNAYTFTGGKLINVSKTYKYPLWTKHLHKTNRMIAKEISLKDRLKEFRTQPDETFIR